MGWHSVGERTRHFGASLLCWVTMGWAAPLAAGDLNLYCAYPDIEVCQAMPMGFAAVHSTRVKVVQKPTGELYAQIRAEARNPKGDVWWGGSGDAFIQAANEDLLERYEPSGIDELHPWALRQAKLSNHRSIGIYRAVLVLAYNTELLGRRKLKPPACWRDLLAAQFHGEVALSDPRSSGTAYASLATVVQVFGEEQGFEYLRKLSANVSHFSRTGAGPLKAVSRGEATVGLAMLHGVLKEQANGFPVGYTVPCEGTGAEIGSAGIIRNAPNMVGARAFLDWAVSQPAQELPLKHRQYSLAAHKRVPLPPGAQIPRQSFVDYDHVRYGSKEQRLRLLDRWTSLQAGER